MMYKVIQYTLMSVISNLMPELLYYMAADEGQTPCIFINKSDTMNIASLTFSLNLLC
jgi:hypothetical protein